MISVANLLTKAGLVLQDVKFTRWTKAELFEWINEGARAVVTRKPSAGAITRTVALAAGSRQTIPENAYLLMNISRNMGPDGNTTGRAVTQATFEMMDASRPDWHSGSVKSAIRNFMYNPKLNAREYYVYPPAQGGIFVEAVISFYPEPITSEADSVPLSLEYEECLINYILFRAYSKDDESSNANMAAAMFSAFDSVLTGQATLPTQGQAA